MRRARRRAPSSQTRSERWKTWRRGLDDQARIENLELIKTDSRSDRFGPVLDPPFVAVVPSPVGHSITFACSSGRRQSSSAGPRSPRPPDRGPCRRGDGVRPPRPCWRRRRELRGCALREAGSSDMPAQAARRSRRSRSGSFPAHARSVAADMPRASPASGDSASRPLVWLGPAWRARRRHSGRPGLLGGVLMEQA